MERSVSIMAIVAVAAAAGLARAGGAVEPSGYGLYYDRREPSFYTGFAPRTLDPARLHLHVGRGNQLRATAVLSDDVLEEYARDLRQRWKTYRGLADEGRLELTQNRAFAAFEQRLREVDLDGLVGEERRLAAPARRERNLALLERLNPGRVFRIRMRVDEIVRRWVAEVRPEDHGRLDGPRALELVNAMLPTRLWASELAPAVGADLRALVARVPASAEAEVTALRAPFLALLARVSGGRYPVEGDTLVFVEFTAVYPVGTFNEYTTWHGRRIPAYPTPGLRRLTTHQRTRTVDHIPTDESYSYSPWLPYMHVGKTMHNSFHTLWWQMQPAKTDFLPADWRDTPFHYLWLLSRGPMSHGCTHVTTGHIAELRQLLPPETDRLYDVDVFYNQSQLFDVFDVDGDLTPEVMGVRYFVAYSLHGKVPGALRAPMERRAYYEWLYGGELAYDGYDRGVFHGVRDARFVGPRAVAGREYDRVALWEAPYEPERVQFYRLVDIPFARELRQVSVRHPFPGLVLEESGASASR